MAVSPSLILTLEVPGRRTSTAPSSGGPISRLFILMPRQARLTSLNFAMIYMLRSVLSASPVGGSTNLAAELFVNRRIRGTESFFES